MYSNDVVVTRVELILATQQLQVIADLIDSHRLPSFAFEVQTYIS